MLIEARIMNPIATSLISAVVYDLGKGTIAKAYNALRGALERKLGTESEVIKAIEGLEADPNSPGYKLVLQEKITKANIEKDPELVNLAQKLLDLLEDRQGEKQNIVQNVSNVKYAATSATGNASIGNITEHPESSK